MFARRQPVIEAMDRAANWFWKPWFVLFGVKAYDPDPKPKQQRRFRYLPLFLLLVCALDIGLMVAGRPFAAMIVIVNLVGTITLQIQIHSPIGPSTRGPGLHPRDEREIALFRLGHLWGMFVVMLLAVAGCAYFAIAQALPGGQGESIGLMLTGHRLWFPTDPTEWFVLGFLLVTVEINIAVLVTSWSVPVVDPDED